MIEEIRILGVYMPAGLLWAGIALVIASSVRGPLFRLPLRSIFWYPVLVELAFFLLLWWGIARLADSFLPHGLIS
jgi:protein AaeX